MTTAIDNGYKLIDCAHVYGNEAEIGAALKDGFESGKIKREDLFVTSKVSHSSIFLKLEFQIRRMRHAEQNS